MKFDIERKTFDRFRRPFVTDKYITVVQWEEIYRKIEKFVVQEVKSDGKKDTARSQDKNQFIVDDVLCVKTAFVPKSESYINFRRLSFDYKLDWIVAVTITKVTHEKVILPDPVVDPHFYDTEKTEPEPKYKPTEIIESITSEYDPISNSNGVTASYTASRRSLSTDNRTSPEYLPASTNVTPVKYTPMKIPKKNQQSINNNVDSDTEPVAPERPKFSSLQEDIFGKDSDDDLHEENNSEIKSNYEGKEKQSKSKKRRLMFAEKEEKEVSAGRKPRKRVEHKKISSSSSSSKASESHRQTRATSSNKIQPKQQTMDVWMSTEKKIDRPDTPDLKDPTMSWKKKSNSKSRVEKPEATIGENIVSKDEKKMMDDFFEKFRKKEEEHSNRRDELENVVIMKCDYLSEDDLEELVISFSPTIKRLFKEEANNKTAKLEYNFLIATTTHVLTENQILFVLQKIENQRDPNEIVCSSDAIVSDTILPEFIIHVLCSEYNFSKEDALNQLNKQMQRQLLFEEAEADL